MFYSSTSSCHSFAALRFLLKRSKALAFHIPLTQIMELKLLWPGQKAPKATHTSWSLHWLGPEGRSPCRLLPVAFAPSRSAIVKEAFCFMELLPWSAREGMKSHGYAYIGKPFTLPTFYKDMMLVQKMFRNPRVTVNPGIPLYISVSYEGNILKHFHRKVRGRFLRTSSVHRCFHCGYCCCCCCCLRGLCRVHYMPNGFVSASLAHF